jgi:hypothetical protein
MRATDVSSQDVSKARRYKRGIKDYKWLNLIYLESLLGGKVIQK